MTTKKLTIINLILMAIMFALIIFSDLTNFYLVDLTTFLGVILIVIQQLVLCYYFYKNKQKKYSVLGLFYIIIIFIFYIKRFF